MTAPLIRLESCASTNTELLRLAESGAEAFTTVVARYQSAGRSVYPGKRILVDRLSLQGVAKSVIKGLG